MKRKFWLLGIPVLGIIFLSLTLTFEKSTPEIKSTSPVTEPVVKQEQPKPKIEILSSTAHAETPLDEKKTKQFKAIIPLDPKDIHYKDEVAVLTYHNLDEKESAYTISPARFHEQLEALKTNHYNVIPMEEFIQFLEGKGDVPPNAVVLTFDDGYESVYRYALPELKQQDLPATVFLIVSYVDSNKTNPSFLKWSEVAEMKQNGFSFYSHTYNLHQSKPNGTGKDVPEIANPIFLPDLKRVETEQEYEDKVKSDLSDAEEVLKEKLGNQYSMLCFPHGAYNKTLINLAEQDGIHYFFTGKPGINTRKAREIYRIEAGANYISTKNLIWKLNSFHPKEAKKQTQPKKPENKAPGLVKPK